MRMNIGSMENVITKYKDGEHKENYVGFIEEARGAYNTMFNNSKTLTDVIIYNIRINSKFTTSAKLLLEDIGNLLINGVVCDFSKYLLIEPSGVANSTLNISIDNGYKNYTNGKYEFNYLINKIGLDSVMKMLEGLLNINR